MPPKSLSNVSLRRRRLARDIGPRVQKRVMAMEGNLGFHITRQMPTRSARPATGAATRSRWMKPLRRRHRSVRAPHEEGLTTAASASSLGSRVADRGSDLESSRVKKRAISVHPYPLASAGSLDRRHDPPGNDAGRFAVAVNPDDPLTRTSWQPLILAARRARDTVTRTRTLIRHSYRMRENTPAHDFNDTKWASAISSNDHIFTLDARINGQRPVNYRA